MDSLPVKAAIDPRRLLIDRVYDDNSKRTDVCMSMQNYELSQEYLEQVLPLARSAGDDVRTATVLHNFGRLYRQMDKDSAALQYYTEALELRRKINHEEGIQTTLLSLASIYRDQGNDVRYLALTQESMDINEKTGNKAGLAQASYYLGNYYSEKGDLNQAEVHYRRSLDLGIEMGSLNEQHLATYGLYSVYYQQEKGMKALDMYQRYISFRDSINAKEAKKGLVKLEVEHEFEKEQLVQEQEAKETARIQAEQVERRNNLQYSGIGIGIFSLFGLVFLFGRFQLPKWAVELAVFLPILILFEFVLVITDPWVDALTGGAPMFKLLINAAMAGAIFPLHAFFEKLLKKRLFTSRMQ